MLYRLGVAWCLAAGVTAFGTGFAAHADFEAPTPGPNTTGDPFNPKIWEVWARLYVGYDSNVTMTADGDPFFIGDTDSPYLGITAGGLLRYPVTPDVTVGAAVEVDKIWHVARQDVPDFNSEQRDYDWLSVSPTVFADYSFQVADTPAQVGVSYNFRKDFRPEHAASEALGLESHSVGLT